MKRRHFIRSSLASGIVLTLSPNIILSQNTELPYNELIGKGNPDLFGYDYLLRKEANEAFLDMRYEAEKSDILIEVVSSYRNYEHQRRIWERKFSQYISNGLSPLKSINKIIEYSTIPGTSRHHWGTEIDIVDGNFMNTPNLLSVFNFNNGQPFYNLKIWLEEHAKTFDYYIVYTDEKDRKGFKYEPWHYSFRPLSCDYLKQYRDLDLFEIFKKENFEGAQHITESFMQQYFKENILDINPELLL